MKTEDVIRMAEEAGIEFQCHIGIGGRENISTCGSQGIQKITRLVELAMTAGRWAADTRRGTLMFDPYTGQPRHPTDIASDPHGVLIQDPERKPQAAAPAKRVKK